MFQAEHFQGLLDKGLIGLEKNAIGFMIGAAVLQTSAAFLYASGSIFNIAKAIVTFGFFADKVAEHAAQAASSLAGAASTTASILQTLASYERREEWQFQKTLAEHDIRIGQQQMTLAVDHAYIVDQERFVASMQVEHSDSTMEFLANKFTNVELYENDKRRARVYAYFLQQATAMAKLAQNQLAFERQEAPPEFIQADYWQTQHRTRGPAPKFSTPDRQGLTGRATAAGYVSVGSICL